MSPEELVGWEESFEAFHERFADLFARRESREQMGKYLRGLLAGVERKNGWQVAEALGDATPDRMQRLLYRVEWDAEVARDRLQEFVIEVFGDADGIGVIDETGFIKKGRDSVGVQRQYSGTAGKVENCQIGTFLSYATPRGHVLLDRRLYLPESWCADSSRRAEAKVPAEVVFQTKPQQAREMLGHAWEQGVPMRWVTGDEVYGNDPSLRAFIQAQGRGYVLAVASTTPVWRLGPDQLPAAPGAETMAAVVAGWPAGQWERLTVAEGEKGPRVYDWGRMLVIESRHQRPGPTVGLLARRSVSDPSEIAYYLAYSPEPVSLQTLAQVAATRYTVEQCFEEAKGETGLDEYEVRHYHSGYRHITLSMMAHAWLAAVRATQAEKRGAWSRNWRH
jgi:SRSO17 transposase